MVDIFKRTKEASRGLALISDSRRNDILRAVAAAIEACKDTLLSANADDLAHMDKTNPLYDRLMLTSARLDTIAADMRHVAQLPSPLGRETCVRTLDNGLYLRRISVPFGVVGVIYEARPNVSFDVFALCFKSGNACLLKGGADADNSNRAIIELIHSVLVTYGIDTAVVELLPATHEATAQLLGAVGFVDLCIPRGGKKLISFVRDTARVPVIETGAGVVSTYFDEYGDIVIGTSVINNAKTRRVSVCNALDCLIVHHARINDLPRLCKPLAGSGVTIYADADAYAVLDASYPSSLLCHATSESYGTEYMDYAMAIKTVASIDEAIRHIEKYGSGHSECIITQDCRNADIFRTRVDAACVYVNAPTSFTDGAQFGLGAEIGISTQKLGPRGPMGLNELTTYKWLIDGNGQVRN